MAENLNLQLTVDTSGATTSVGSLKKQLREAQNEVMTLADKFGATSKEAIEAAKRAGELKDRIGDAKALTDAFNPDAKFKALTASLSGVAGGFGAVQGAMALFGVESEDVQKTLLKVQSAMAISQGLQSVGESIDSFKQLGAVIKSTTIFQKANEMANKAAAFSLKALGISAEVTSTSFKVMKTAIISTGIGVLIIALGEAVAAFQSFQSSAEKAAEAQAELNKKTLEYADMSLQSAQDVLARLEKVDVAKAKSSGKSEKDIFDIEESYRLRKRESLKKHWIEIGETNVDGRFKDEQEIKKSLADSQVAQYEFDLAQKKKAEDKNKQAADRNKQNDEKSKQLQKEKDDAELDAQDKIIKLKTEIEIAGIADEYQAKKAAIDAQLLQEINLVNANEKLKSSTKTALIIELGNKANSDIAKINKDQNEEQDKKDKEALLKKQEDERGIRALGVQQRIEDINKLIAANDVDFQADKERYSTKLELLKEQQAIELENTELTEFEKTQIYKKYGDERIKIIDEEALAEKKAQDAKMALQLQYIDFAAQAGALIGQIAGKSKAVAIAGLLIEKGAAIAKIVTQMMSVPAILPPGIPNPAFIPARIGGALSIASVIAASAQGIQSINSAAAGGGGGGGMPNVSTSAPIIPAAPQAQTTNISQASINQMGNQAVRAYVIETDVTSNQQRVEAIKQRARFS